MATSLKVNEAKQSKASGIGPLAGFIVFIALIIWAIIDHAQINEQVVNQEEVSIMVKLIGIISSWFALVVMPAFLVSLMIGVAASFLAHLYYDETS